MRKSKIKQYCPWPYWIHKTLSYWIAVSTSSITLCWSEPLDLSLAGWLAHKACHWLQPSSSLSCCTFVVHSGHHPCSNECCVNPSACRPSQDWTLCLYLGPINQSSWWIWTWQKKKAEHLQFTTMFPFLVGMTRENTIRVQWKSGRHEMSMWYFNLAVTFLWVWETHCLLQEEDLQTANHFTVCHMLHWSHIMCKMWSTWFWSENWLSMPTDPFAFTLTDLDRIIFEAWATQ